jgi:hypothetical protein
MFFGSHVKRNRERQREKEERKKESCEDMNERKLRKWR